MKATFTPFQIVLTVVNLFLYICCIIGDLFLLMPDTISVNRNTYIINLALSALAMILFLFLIFNTKSINIFGDKPDPDCDPAPALSALRTYFCMLAFDFGGVLALMFVGPLLFQDAKYVILIFAPAVFVAAAVTYFISSSRIGLADFDDEEDSQNNLF